MIREYYELKARHARLVVYIRSIFIVLLAGVITIATIAIPEVLIHKKPQPIHATMAQKKANRILAHQMAIAGWGWTGKQLTCIDKIFMKESRYDHLATNKTSTAYGLAQHLGESSKIPAIQIARAFRYIQFRYKNPCRAWYFHAIHNWY